MNEEGGNAHLMIPTDAFPAQLPQVLRAEAQSKTERKEKKAAQAQLISGAGYGHYLWWITIMPDPSI